MDSVDVSKNSPEKKFRAAPITATIWVNEVKGRDGELRSFRTISLERSYKDKNDIWQNTTSLRVNDLPKAVLVLNKAYEYVSVREENPVSISEE